MVLGGLALFLFGMKVMTDGLRGVAGSGLRAIISKVGRNNFNGLGTGTLSGFLLHSSATTVLLVAFVNASVFFLLESIPVIFGANIGTTFSMQVISLYIGVYTYFILAAGCFSGGCLRPWAGSHRGGCPWSAWACCFFESR